MPDPVPERVIAPVRDRASPYAFDPAPVDPDAVLRCLEAARWAASSFNEQPWRYIVGIRSEDEATWQGLLDCLVDGNRTWARHAPVLMLSVASTRFGRNDKPNRHAWHDTGLATAQLMLQATAEGLVTHAMGGFHREMARERFAIPDDHEPVAALALGRLGDGTLLDDAVRARDALPRERRPMDAMIAANTWGQVPGWLSR